MMEKKYELVAWTRNITDQENARLNAVPDVMIDLLEPLIDEVSECRWEQERNAGYIDLELARRFARVYYQAAQLDIFTGYFIHAIRFLLQAADYCCHEELQDDFVRYCEEALELASKKGLEHVLNEAKPKRTLGLYRQQSII